MVPASGIAVSYKRGSGYDDTSVLTVYDCLALQPDAAQGLLASLASWGTVAPTLRMRLLPWHDAVNAVLPLERVREHRTQIVISRGTTVCGSSR